MGVRLTRRPLSVAAAYRALEQDRAGGVAIFVGRVRPDRLAKGVVTHLFYEAHVAVAERQLRELEEKAIARFGLTDVVLWHRLGELPVGSASVLVGAAAAHRDAAFRGARFLIDRLKSEVPIWKTDRARSGRRPRRPPGRRRGRSAG
jgi:molybdopterin synthase catalytic subunit